MAAIAPIADTGFVVSLLDRLDGHHEWTLRTAEQYPPPWQTCEAVLSETFHTLGLSGKPAVWALIGRGAFTLPFALHREQDHVISLMKKYSDTPMSFADACLVRMTEVHWNSIVLTTDSDFRVYRRHGRRAIPLAMPG